MNERTTVRLPAELLKRAKRMAADEGSTLTAWIEDGLRLKIARHAKVPTSKRVMPRVSKAKGACCPAWTSPNSPIFKARTISNTPND